MVVSGALCFVDRASRYVCNETNLMHYVPSAYSVTIFLHVSDLLVAHHQEATMYVCNKWYVLYVLVDCQWAWPVEHNITSSIQARSADSQLKHKTLTICCIYTLLPLDDGQITSLKHVEV
jgi:hypothetical protein